MTDAPDFLAKLARDMAQGAVEEKEAFLLKQFKAQPSLLRRIEDIVIEETPMQFSPVMTDEFDIESNEYKFAVTYNLRIRTITNAERVQRYINREFEKIAAHVPDLSLEAEESIRADLDKKGWYFIREGVLL